MPDPKNETTEMPSAPIDSQHAILARLRQAKPGLSHEFPIRRMALFGSWARGDQTEQSDVDILVDVDPSIGLEFVTLADRLEEILGRRVDLVSHRALRPRHFQNIEPELINV